MRHASLMIVIALVACGKESTPTQTTTPIEALAANRCSVELSADKSKYFETAQRLGADFSKLAKLPFSAGLENQVKSVVADSFQAIPESSVKCLIVAKLQACALDAKNDQLALRMQDTVEKTCAGVSSSAAIGKPSISGTKASTQTSSRLDLWACIPPGRRGSDTSLETEDPSRGQLSGGVLYWSSKPSSDAIRCVERLVAAGADPNYSETEPAYEGYFGGPPLHLALSHKRWDMADTLLKAGADPQRRSVWRQQSALEVAKGWGAPDTVLASLGQSGN